jgi:tRNA threonylcarbamoyladenosine biosynthesis protein TsaB
VVLALDASGKTASACVLRGERVLREETLDAGLTHSETLLPLAQRTLGAAGLTPRQVQLYAVTGGPGSFTGLRIAMALVKGMALPRTTPAVAVSTLEALALAFTHLRPQARGIVLPALDARRGEVYWAAFELTGALPRRLVPDTVGPAAKIAASGLPDGREIFLVGDGAKICYNKLNYSPVSLSESGVPPIATGAGLLAVRAWNSAQGGDGGFDAACLRPRYLRLSQAERERKFKLEQP